MPFGLFDTIGRIHTDCPNESTWGDSPRCQAPITKNKAIKRPNSRCHRAELKLELLQPKSQYYREGPRTERALECANAQQERGKNPQFREKKLLTAQRPRT